MKKRTAVILSRTVKGLFGGFMIIEIDLDNGQHFILQVWKCDGKWVVITRDVASSTSSVRTEIHATVMELIVSFDQNQAETGYI